MAGFLLNEAAVKVKSEELHIPFSNLLPAAIVEYMLSSLSESEYEGKPGLRTAAVLDWKVIKENRFLRYLSITTVEEKERFR